VNGNPLSYTDPLGLLTTAAQAIVDGAMISSNGDTFNAYANILNQRSNNPTDASLAEAEHYLFARDWTSTSDGAAAVSLVPAIPLYTVAKTIADVTGNLPSDTSKPSFNEIKAGLEGVLDGIKDAVGIKPKKKNTCAKWLPLSGATKVKVHMAPLRTDNVAGLMCQVINTGSSGYHGRA
jgi:hypothetical protein